MRILDGMVLLVLLAGVMAPVAGRAATPVTANGVVAIVNDEVITLKDVLQEIQLATESKRAALRSRPDQLEREMQKAQQEAVEILIERKLILNEFKTAGYNIPESVIEDRVRRQLRERWGGDRAAMTRELQSRGTTLERLRQQERERFIVAIMRSKNVAQELIVSPFKIEKYYVENLDRFKVGDQVRLRMIMLNKGTGAAVERARQRAAEIVGKLAEGANFSEMAGVYSEDSYRREGGDRGWVDLSRENYHPQLEQVIRALKPGERSGVIELDTALWVLQVEDTKLNHTRTLPEVRAEIEQILMVQERTRLEKEWIDRLKAKAFIRMF